MSATWHLDTSVLESYATGRSTPVGGASVEAHLMECRECGAVLRELMPREPLDRAWRAIRARVEEPRAGLVERLLAALGLSSESARLLAAVPAFRGAWLLGTVHGPGLCGRGRAPRREHRTDALPHRRAPDPGRWCRGLVRR